MQTKKIRHIGGTKPDIPNQLECAAILAHYSQSANNIHKKPVKTMGIYLDRSKKICLRPVKYNLFLYLICTLRTDWTNRMTLAAWVVNCKVIARM